ncbi:nephrin-like isoform X2 [Artemia franciscana]|uniref:nephrin-like isoform X2 n=1 Tax=Artemia franciscana TaxID=6661 RepID=UPI0032DA7567
MDCRFVGFFILLSYTKFVFCQQQYFQERPQNTSVKEGERAVLRCKIANQQGRVQWVKNGFALGHDRTIPGHGNRYSMIGEVSAGEHHLQIENATSSDDGEYQCQVGPKGPSKPIRSDATLSVLIPPTSVDLLDVPRNGKVDIKENEELVITCVIRGAKPAAEVVWYKRNKKIEIGVREDETTPADQTNRFDTRSKLTIRPQADDNGAEYTCEAKHPAITLVTSKKASVQLSVLYPPGPPEIIGYTEGETIRTGQEIHLICVARGGNPLAQVIWYQNNIRVDTSYRTSGRESRNEYTFVANSTDNGAKFRCEAGNLMTPTPMKTEVAMTVFFAPDFVKITGPTEAKIGDTLALECSTGNSNPEARISWVVDGRPVKDATSRVIQSAHGGTVSRSNITALVKSNERNLTIACYAVIHELGFSQTIVDTKIVSVIHPPQKPVIYGISDSNTGIREGNLIRLSCMAVGGNPLAQIKWFQGKKEIKGEYAISGNVASSRLDLMAKREDNEKQIRCEAHHPADDGLLSESVKLKIDFPPTRVSAKVRPEKLRPGVTAILSCETGSASPAASVSWWRDGLVLPLKSNSTIPGQHAGLISKAIYEVEVTPDLDGSVFMCQAASVVMTQNIHDAVNLEVLYKPTYYPSTGIVIDVVEGGNASKKIECKANPSKVTYSWSRDGISLRTLENKKEKDTVVFRENELFIFDATRDDDGVYKLEGTNAEGTHSVDVRVNVQYAPFISSIQPVVTVGEGRDAFLECQATGNPLSSSTVAWRREGFDMTRVDIAADAGRAYMTIKNAKREDIGAFECVANNGIGGEVVALSNLVVKYRPVMSDDPQHQKAAANEGETATLTCRAYGAPNVTFTWTRDGATITSNDRISIDDTQVDLITWETTLQISGIRSRDHGSYDCIARNELGFNRTVLVLSGTSRPDPPVSLVVLNTTHESVVLTWKPGFDGGLQQSYRIRYRQVASEAMKYADVYPSNATDYALSGLKLGTEYLFSIMSWNELGESNYTTDIVRARTSTEVPVTAVKSRGYDASTAPSSGIPKVIVIAITIVGTALLVLNVVLIACFVKRRNRRRLLKDLFDENMTERERMMAEILKDRADVSKIVIVGVSIAVSLLLILNLVIAFVCCFRRKKKLLEEASSDGCSSSKSGTIEMYAPSSYNGTVTGETLSSISEKSETYSHNGSHEDYQNDVHHGKPALSTYLVDPIEPPKEYNHRNLNLGTGGTLPRINKLSNYIDQENEDNYIDTMRRNAYNQSIGDNVNYTTSTGRPPSRNQIMPSSDAYFNIAMGDRYPPYPTPSPSISGVPPPMPNISTGSLRFNSLDSDRNVYTPMGSLNIPSKNGWIPPITVPSNGLYDHERSPTMLEPPITVQYPATATVRNIETEGHLV